MNYIEQEIIVQPGSGPLPGLPISVGGLCSTITNDEVPWSVVRHVRDDAGAVRWFGLPK